MKVAWAVQLAMLPWNACMLPGGLGGIHNALQLYVL